LCSDGDFNSSAAWDASYGSTDHRDFDERVRQEFGVMSAYHAATGEPHGQETRPTHYWRWRQSAPFHLDYCHLPESWVRGITQVAGGSYEHWADASDHRPLTVDVSPRVSLGDDQGREV
jgi:endonuclease/exonuclease/phosphatase family metal-dependent hydrolase